MVVQTKTKITADEFFQLPETNLPTELIDGEIIQMPSPIPEHQRALRRIVALVGRLIPNGEIFFAPLDVYFDDGNIVQPDLLWVAENSRCVITEKRLVGAPDLVIEILSPGSTRHDRKTKFRLYEKHGVREYWIIDLSEPLVEVWQHIDGKFDLLDVYGADEMFTSPLLGEVVVSEIFPQA
jgi:Uma2 family endonuclease